MSTRPSHLAHFIPRLALAVAVCAGVGIIATPRPAQAQWAVADVPLETALGGKPGYLQTYTLYMSTGIGSMPGGNGVIELLGAAGQKLDNINEFNRQYFKLLKQSQISTAAQAIQMQRSIADNAQAIEAAGGGSPLSCSSMGAGEAGAAGGSTSVQVAKQLGAAANDNLTKNHNDTANLAAKVISVQTYCDANDVANKRLGCSQAGTYPDADIDMSTIFRGVQPRGSSVVSNQTLETKAQQDAATAYINNMMPLPAPQPQGTAANSVDGKKALVEMRLYNARLSPAKGALAAITAARAPVTSLPNSFGGRDAWSQASSDYSTVFPGQAAPKNPSAREMLSYFVNRTLYSPKYYASNVASASGDDLTRELIKQVAYNNHIQLLLLDRQEQGNALLSAMLLQSVDPITRASVASHVPAGSLQGAGAK